VKELKAVEFDPVKCRKELDELGSLLNEKPVLKERDDILPFFKDRVHLSAFVSVLFPVSTPNRYAHEFDLFGDYRCDLVAGSVDDNVFCLIEFEDGKADSIFHAAGRTVPEWASRFEHGYSQVVDWLSKLDGTSDGDMEQKFGTTTPRFHGLLVIGHGVNMEPRERRRFEFRRNKVVVNSIHINVLTFQELHDALDRKLKPIA